MDNQAHSRFAPLNRKPMAQPAPVIQTLADLVRIESVNPEWGGPGERGVANYVRQFFADAGIETAEVEALTGRPNIIAKVPGRDASRRIVLEAHMDTVTAEGMEIPPLEPKIDGDGRLYGRGSCDVKAGLAAMMHAVRDLGDRPPCEVWLAAVIDEEHAYRGVLSLIESLGEDDVRTEAAIVAEPTECRIVRANKGVLRWRVITHGVAAHSSKPHLGENAIASMARVILALEEDSAKLAKTRHPLVGSPTLCISLIEGGAQVNFVPERCEISIDRRLLPGESADDVLAGCQRVLDGIPNVRATLQGPDLADEAMETPENAAVVRVAQKVAAAMDLDSAAHGVPFGCDCTKLSRAGVPSIIFGPGSIDRAHAAVEFVEVRQVELAVDFYRRFLLEFGS